MSAFLLKHKWSASLLLLIALLGVFLALQQAEHQGEWQPQHARLPEVSISAEHIHIRQIRDFRYHPDGQPETQRYLEQDYDLASLQAIWLGISHFGNHGLAHTFLSFEFAGQGYLVASVEARLRPEQRYHPLSGMLRQYNKLIVLGTEADVIGLRSHVRGERVLLYRLHLDAEQRRHLFLGMMDEVQAIAQAPVFYNTLLANCTTSLLRHDPQHRLWQGLFDYRLLLPGHSDAYARQRGWLASEPALPQQRRTAQIEARHSPDAADFSQLIRRPAYQQLSLSLLVMQQQRFDGSAVQSEGVVRGFADPEHYWVEDSQLNRVALLPNELARDWLGKRVTVAGRFSYHPERGRRLQLDHISAAP